MNNTDNTPAMIINTVRTICEPNGRYYGRPSLQILADGTWVMVYVRSKHHWKDAQGRIEIMFSGDEGRTWSEPNTCLDGTPVKGMPSRTAPPESPYDPVEPYVYLAPSGELVATAMKEDLSGLGKGLPIIGDGCAWITVSADNGRTWDAWRKVTFENLPEGQSPETMDLTQDSFADGEILYAASRMRDKDRRVGSFHKVIAGLFTSADNGRIWRFVNYIDPDVNWDRTLDCETGIERVGPTEIVAVTRGTLQGCALPWLTRSHDMGRTWSPLVQAEDKVLSWKRPRIYTSKHLRHMSGAETIPEWWDDNVLIGTGVIQISQPPNVRNAGLWISTDKGATWSAPLHLDGNTEDAGYGDLRMRRNGEIVVVSYHGNHETAAIKQYVVQIEK